MIRKAIAALRTTTTYLISTRTFQGDLFGYYTDDHFRWWLPAERAGWDEPSFIHYWKDKCWGGCFGTPNPALYTRPPKPDRYARQPTIGWQAGDTQILDPRTRPGQDARRAPRVGKGSTATSPTLQMGGDGRPLWDQYPATG